MAIHVIRHFPGDETFELRQLNDGSWACPVCGTPWPYPPLSPVVGEDDISCPAMGDICPGCDVEYGFDEPVTRDQYIRSRIEWLDRVGWTPQALQQLHDNLGLTEEQVRGEAVKVHGRE